MDTEPDKPPLVSMEELQSEVPAKEKPRSLMDSLTEPVEPARTGASGKSSDDYGDTATHASDAPEKAAKTPRVGLLGLLAEREKRKAAEARAHQVKTVRTETVTESRVTGNQSMSKSDFKKTDSSADKSSTDRKDNRDSKSTRGHDLKKADSSADKSSTDRKKADTGSTRDHRNADSKSDTGHDSKKSDTASRADKSSTDRKDSRSVTGGNGNSGRSAGTVQPPAKAPAQTATRVPTQGSREAGYRDGNRAARGAGHVQAYGDGTRDGWQDGRKSSQAQREELNRRRDEKAQPENKETEGMTTPTDTAPKPVVVTSVDKSGVTLGDGARPSMTRGEVRSLRSFQLRLEEQENFLIRKADVARQISAAAAQLHAEAALMQESVKAVKGGEKLSGALARLVESSQGRVTAAEEVHTKALRAAEQAKTVRTNADTRYAPIYQAVVDSDETAPAELAFYRDGGVSRG